MNILTISDIHGTSRIPRNRIGDPLEDFESKLDFIFATSAKLNNAPIIASGDLFDTPRDIDALYTFLKVRTKYPDTEFFTVYGQHDMYFRNTSSASSLLLLSKARQIVLLGKLPYWLSMDIRLYGCNWGDPIPKVKDKSKLNILSIHAPIYLKPLFPGHSYINVIDWQKKSKAFKFIICGDIHRSFIYEGKSNIICNTGPLMRLDNSNYSMKHVPKVFCYNTLKHKIKTYEIPHKPAKQVLKKLESKASENEEASISESFIVENKSKNIGQIIDEFVEKSKDKDVIRARLLKIANYTIKTEFSKLEREYPDYD